MTDLSSALAGLPDLFVAVDRDHHLISFNPAFAEEAARLFGRRPRVGQGLAEWLADWPREREAQLSLWRRALAGTAFVTEHVFDGDRRQRRQVWHLSFSPLRDDCGRPTGAALVARDIGDRVRAEEEMRRRNDALQDLIAEQTLALHDSERRYRLAVDGAGLGTWELLPEDMAVRWSDRHKRMLGLPATAEASMAAWLRRIHPDDRAEAGGRMAAANDPASDGAFHSEYRVVWPDGTIRWHQANGRAFFIEEAGTRRPERFLGVVRDVTDEKETERALRESEAENRRARTEAERANVAKSKFLAAASHDLRQPVQSLLLFAALLGQQLAGHASAPVLASMNQALDALKVLLDSLLDVSRLDAGIIAPHMVAFAADDLLGRLAGEYAVQAAGKGLTLRVVPTRGWLRSDPALLERVLRNLMENALRYTARGGIVIGCRRAGADAVRLVVADTGLGIADDQRAAIFDEFYQVGNPERDRSQGLGLGLAVVRRLCDLMEHTVTLDSRPGRGSSFAVTVATAAPVRPLGEERGALIVPAAGQGLRVLVIDDEAIVRTGLAALLEAWGYRVLAAGCADEATRLLAANDSDADLIIADYRLRDGHTGPDAIERVNAQLGRRLPALIITGDTAPERMVEAQRNGHGLLHKPVAAERLRELVARLVSGGE